MPYRAGQIDDRLIAAARKVAGPAGAVSVGQLAIETGLARSTVRDGRVRLRVLGRWPWEDYPSGDSNLSRAAQARRGLSGETVTALEREEIARNKAEVDRQLDALRAERRPSPRPSPTRLVVRRYLIEARRKGWIAAGRISS